MSGHSNAGTTHLPLAQTTELEDPVGVTAERMAEDLGITKETAIEYLTRRSSVGEFYAALQASLPSFDEMYIEYEPEYSLVVLTTTGDEAGVVSLAEGLGLSELVPLIDVRTVEFTTDQLAAALELLETLSAPMGVEFVGEVDIQEGSLWISTDSNEAVQILRGIVDAGKLGIPSDRVAVVAEGLFSDLANSFGGLDLNRQSDHAAECTTGFSVEQTSGGSADGVSTAAHCANLLEFNSGDDLSAVQGARERDDQDVQWHTTSGYDDQPWVRDGGTSHRVVTGRTARSGQMVNDYVCLSRRNDTVECGLIESKTFDPGTGFNATFIRVDDGSNTLAGPGDSGGPWWATIAGTPGCTCAYGILKGAPVADLTDAVYMAQNYMGVLNIRPKIG